MVVIGNIHLVRRWLNGLAGIAGEVVPDAIEGGCVPGSPPAFPHAAHGS
jgi:hypothetical protein